MKTTLNFFIAIAILLISSCKKGEFTGSLLASLTVTNATVDGQPIRAGCNITPIANNNYAQLTLIAGDNDLYIWPVGDSTHPYFTTPKFNAEDREVYSLFLAGQAPNIAGVLIKDKIPYHTDSTCGVRIINLSPNSPSLNITLSTTPTVNEVTNLLYLQATEFILYPAKAANTNYIFQVRKSLDNSLLTSYSLTVPRFANVTLVIKGLVGSNPTINMLRVNNDR